MKFEGNVLIFEAGFAGRNDTTKNDDYTIAMMAMPAILTMGDLRKFILEDLAGRTCPEICLRYSLLSMI